MKELLIEELNSVSGGYYYKLRPVSSNVEDRRVGLRNMFWSNFDGIFPRFGSNLPTRY